jgi:hypothetical protein
VYYVDPCSAASATPRAANKVEQAPAPRSTPRSSPAHTPATGPAPATSPSRLPSNFSRDYPVEAPAAPPIEPSSPSRRPSVSESIERKQYYDAYFVASDAAVRQVGDGTRSVCFWNLSPQRLSLEIAGKPYVLEARKQLTLDLPRTFTWQIAGRAAEDTVLDDTREAMEIVIRK